MRKCKKIPALAVILVLCISIMTMSALAMSTTQDGLEVSLTTDKESYGQDEDIVATLTVTNTNDTVVGNVSLEGLIPDGYTLADGSEATKEVESLASGASVSLIITYVTDDSSGSAAGTATDTSASSSSSGSESSESGSTTDAAATGDSSNILLWAILLLLSGGGIVVLVVRNKKAGKKLLSLFLCVAATGAITATLLVPAEAADAESKSISISESVTVDGADLAVSAVVKYDVEAEQSDEPTGLPKPEDPSEADDYYWDTSTVIEVINANESDDTLTETEAIAVFKDRGFEDYPVVCEYSIDGECSSGAEATDGSSTKHPLYRTFYVTDAGNVWTVYIINGDVFAYPASFNVESDLDAVVIISESETLTSYDDESNQFYVTIPYESTVILKTVERIDAETLNQLTSEELNQS